MTQDEPGRGPAGRLLVQVRDGDRSCDLTVEPEADGRLVIQVTGTDADGAVQVDLRGTARPHDLALLGRLLLVAATSEALPTTADFIAEQRRRHPNAYRSWTTADDERLGERFRDGTPIPQLMEEFGRNRGAIASRLRHLGIGTPGG